MRSESVNETPVTPSSANAETTPGPSTHSATPTSRTRHITEAIIFLALAVVLIRAFQVEGYLITTGSMASSLHGAHERLTCPHCQFPLVVGVSFDESSPDPFHQELSTEREEFTTCPNCGEPRIPLAGPATSQGDQILIHKGSFLFREPRRFEPALFRNPDQPHEVYIKRIIGLPGETVLLKEGDLFINGNRVVKTLDQQRQLRELIHDENYSSNNNSDFEVRPRWLPQQEASTNWSFSEQDHAWTFPTKSTSSPSLPTSSEFAWLQYQHWLALGGRHLTTVSLPKPEKEIGLPPSPEDQPDSTITDADLEAGKIEQQDLRFPFQLPKGSCPVQLDQEKYELTIFGVLSQDWYQKLAKLNQDRPEYLSALAELKTRSHLAPITDFNSYNPTSLKSDARAVKDLMVSFQLQTSTPNGQLIVRFNEGENTFNVLLDFASHQVSLYLAESHQPVLTHPLPVDDFSMGQLIELSTFDRHLLLAIDNKIVIDSWSLPYWDTTQPYARTPVEIGARNGAFTIRNLQFFRDLYYRSDFPGLVRHATLEPYSVKQDEFFVLGDNSMRSWDSRCWGKPVVPRNFLLGRPLIVHLPSQSLPEQLGGHHFNLRIPDLDRIRLIH